MKISVVMATYNGSAYVLDQLDSLVHGSRPPDELVVVDDASTDDTVAKVVCHMLKSPNISLVMVRNSENLGASASFAKGVRYSTGDLLLFADQDDRWMVHKIATLEKCFLEKPIPCMAYSDGTITGSDLVPDGRTIFGTRNKAKLALGANRDPMEVAINPDVKGCTMAVDGRFARDLFAHTPPGFDKFWGHDHWIALFAYGTGRIQVINEPLIWHRLHGANASAAERFSPFKLSHLKRYLKTIRKQGIDHNMVRYRLAIEYIDAHAPGFAIELRSALEKCLDVSIRRAALKNMGFIAKVKAIHSLAREGIYHLYYNGIFTLIRDLFL